MIRGTWVDDTAHGDSAFERLMDETLPALLSDYEGSA